MKMRLKVLTKDCQKCSLNIEQTCGWGQKKYSKKLVKGTGKIRKCKLKK